MTVKRKKVDISINKKDKDVTYVKSLKYQIFDALKKGDETISSKVAKAFGTTRRRALEKLSSLEEDGLLTSEFKNCRFPSGSVAKTRIFTRK
tara:strand:- start:55 stop:330 length:276 start_codon:yes stop_codon:yes gene_type:complete